MACIGMVHRHQVGQPDVAAGGEEHVLGHTALQLGRNPLAHPPSLGHVLEHPAADLQHQAWLSECAMLLMSCLFFWSCDLPAPLSRDWERVGWREGAWP